MLSFAVISMLFGGVCVSAAPMTAVPDIVEVETETDPFTATTQFSVLKVLFPNITPAPLNPNVRRIVDKVDFTAFGNLCKQRAGFDAAREITGSVFGGARNGGAGLFEQIRTQATGAAFDGLLCKLVGNLNMPENLVNNLLGGIIPLKPLSDDSFPDGHERS